MYKLQKVGLKHIYGKLKHIGMYWVQVFDIRNGGGERKYTLLSKVIKSCLSLQNSSASVERSISDNKNTLRPERISLLDESLMGLRQIKEQAHKRAGAKNGSNLNTEIMTEMKVVHSNYINLKKEEEAERLLRKPRKKKSWKKEEK